MPGITFLADKAETSEDRVSSFTGCAQERITDLEQRINDTFTEIAVGQRVSDENHEQLKGRVEQLERADKQQG